MKIKKIISFALVLGLSISMTVQYQSAEVSGATIVFVDISSNYWAKDQIYSFVNKGIVDGYKDGTFKPQGGVTREEFCKLLVNTFKQVANSPDKATFSDVEKGRWSYPYIEACKEFMAGYANPFGGLPQFHPKEYAKREDIAVALVKMMGFTENDITDHSLVSNTFWDSGEISPALMPYVNLAYEKGLIKGYPDASFRPEKGITRAETVALLNRATKQAVADINKELSLSADVSYNDHGDEAIIDILADDKSTIKVDGKELEQEPLAPIGIWRFKHKFEKEGSKNFIVEAKKAGKSKKITVTAKYEIGAPKLDITDCPSKSQTNSVTIKGKISDSYSPSLKINGE